MRLSSKPREILTLGLSLAAIMAASYPRTCHYGSPRQGARSYNNVGTITHLAHGNELSDLAVHKVIGRQGHNSPTTDNLHFSRGGYRTVPRSSRGCVR